MFNTIQDLEEAVPVVKKMLKEKARLTSIYNVIRGQQRFSLFGDYSIISLIVRLAKEKRVVTAKEVVKTMKNAIDKEFKTIRADSEIMIGLCA